MNAVDSRDVCKRKVSFHQVLRNVVHTAYDRNNPEFIADTDAAVRPAVSGKSFRENRFHLRCGVNHMVIFIFRGFREARCRIMRVNP